MTKGSIDDLAIFGGKPLFEQMLHIGRPNILERERFLERVADILERAWLTNNGRYVQELEQRTAEYLGVKHCIVMCNATVGLEIAIRALGLCGEVIVPSFTFIATAHALQWQEITPVFCDIDPQTHTLDPAQIERVITPRTTGIIGVHVWGRACDIESLAQIAQQRKLRLLYDAAHAFGCSYNGRAIGNFGDAEVFSFHATKFFNTFEGGAVTTNNDDLASKIRLMKNFGFAGQDTVTYIGMNGKMSEISAAMGVTQLENIDTLIALNRHRYQLYQQELAGIPGVRLIEYSDTERRNYQYILLDIETQQCHIHRDCIQQILWKERIRARRYFYPGCHRMEPYRSYFPHAGLLLPETERLTERLLCLPTGIAVEEEDIRRICDLLRFIITYGAEISRKLEYQDTLNEKRKDFSIQQEFSVCSHPL
ncbi:dTDP-4-dehydro-6-deoxyglucose aminotransferase [candidate division KSB3 bacterium]|uniref:dTDP-4-dehydro-6-deoxyglucose aminotransferase n=1 Tax=candidate division KSB3 bacterium TaxID=2044937 RepID=A0A2G6E7C7_9BACT|nr:MAG: dTDP-4-dehydro-6-deoxyglucose aminotransferase [candidate division KSB3 bacterium]PIE30263.1 MAG: dTDP-4-dehydro-6-deoxyglucose aminotransferase [candidate division KSB3 bacterium]